LSRDASLTGPVSVNRGKNIRFPGTWSTFLITFQACVEIWQPCRAHTSVSREYQRPLG
jgi:hypothetical protein